MLSSVTVLLTDSPIAILLRTKLSRVTLLATTSANVRVLSEDAVAVNSAACQMLYCDRTVKGVVDHQSAVRVIDDH